MQPITSITDPSRGAFGLFLGLLLFLVLLILYLTPVPGFGLVAIGLSCATGKGGLAGVELVALARVGTFFEVLEGDGLVAAESLAHVDHTASALAIAFAELLASGGEGLNERGAQAIRRRVALYHDAFAFLQALGQGIAYGSDGVNEELSLKGASYTGEGWELTDFLA